MVSTASTVVGVFDDYAEAANAKQELLQQGFGQHEVSISDEGDSAAAAGSHTEGTGFWAGVRDLFGMDDSEYYEEASRRGSVVLTVNTGPEKIDKAVTILERHDPIDIDSRANEWRGSGWKPQKGQGAGRLSEGDSKSIPVGEERLSIGKRAEKRGGVRIYRRVHETPVEENVHLREETVDVKRRPADRPADEGAFREETIEAHGTREEPVVKKQARVTEEVVIDKDVHERDATVRDKVRRSDVEVEKLDKDQPPKNRPKP